LFQYLLLMILMVGCASGPSEKEFAYHGEALSEIGPYGLLIGHAMVPIDSFPHDQRATVVYFENTKTKKKYEYGKTQGAFYMKLPPGEYVVKDLWAGGMCNTSTGLMISNFFVQLPSNLSYLRGHLEKEATVPLQFKIQQGKTTDIGNLLMTCFEWDARDKFREEFAQYIEGGKFQVFKPMSFEAQECGCKILRKHDGKAMAEFRNRWPLQ